MLDLYDPDRSQTLTERGQIRPWSAFLAAREARGREGAPEPRRRRPVPDRDRHFADAPEADRRLPRRVPGGEVGGVGAGRARQRRPRRGARVRRGGRAAVRLRQGRRRPRARGRLPRIGPGHAALRPRLRVAAQGRGHRTASTRSSDADADGRARRPPAADVAVRDRGLRAAPSPWRSARSPRRGSDGSLRRGRRRGPEGAPRQRPRRRRRVAAAGRARARPRDQRGARQRRQRPSPTRRPWRRGPADQAASFAELVADMEAGKVTTLVIVGGNPVFTAPADLDFAKALGKVGLRIHLGLYDDETSRALPLARAGGAPPRGLERRARVRRHGHDPAAAHRAALRRQVRARAARGLLRPAREDRPRHRQGVLERQAARRRPRAGLAQGAPRRRRRGQRLPVEDGEGAELSDSDRAQANARILRAFDAPVPPRSHHLRRPLRQQRLAAGARQAAHEADLGQRRADRPATAQKLGADDRGRRQAHVRRPQGRGARVGHARPGGELRHGAPRLRPHARRPRRRRQGLRRLRAAHERGALERVGHSRSARR